jgi:ABC-type Zn uptake system ZnuABC Zn-binding protein ZnuA
MGRQSGPSFFTIMVLRSALIVSLLAAALPAFAQERGQERVQVVTTTTDLRSLAEAVGGDRIAAVSLVPPGLDAEEYQPKPQDALRLKQARLLVRVGLDYDLWVDRLLAQVGRPEISRGGPAYVDTSLAIAVLELRGMSVGPGDGHAHGSGNPHYWLDPKNAETITANIFEALARMVAYHNSWPYFARRFRLDFIGFIETKPGVPPSPSHLAGIVRDMRAKEARIVIREPNEPERDVAFVASKAGAQVVTLAASVGALPRTDDYILLFDANVEALTAAAARR